MQSLPQPATPPAAPEDGRVTFQVRLSIKQADKVRALAAEMGLDEPGFIQAFLSHKLPSAAGGGGRDLEA